MAQTVSTGHLIDDVAQRSGLTKADAKKAVQAVVTALSEHLGSGDRIQISGLGSFEVRERAARQATNPRTREQVAVPASKAVGFRAASALRGRVVGQTAEPAGADGGAAAVEAPKPRGRSRRTSSA
jgi:DNA-binding protein HU-beta